MDQGTLDFFTRLSQVGAGTVPILSYVIYKLWTRLNEVQDKHAALVQQLNDQNVALVKECVTVIVGVRSALEREHDDE